MRGLLLFLLLAARSDPERPNIVILLADDLGFGDLGCFGHPTIRTPNLDRMAAEGQKWTSFYSAASVCTPSRAALLTGRLPVRSGMQSDKRRVLFPDSKGGLPPEEVTLAEALKARGYATAAFGKWHLGHLPPFLPTRQGFDSYLGIPYSNDMDRTADRSLGQQVWREPKIEYWNVPLLRNEEAVERPADQTTLTNRYTQEAVRFIRASRGKPFFLYLAYHMPHVPLFRSPGFAGRSLRGLYGDVVEELDWSVGEILQALRDEGAARDTLVAFTSDNGPWLLFNDLGGSAGLLREGKGCTFEGGMRVPCVMWWPGRLAPGVVTGIGSTMDLYTTSVKLAGGEVPKDRVVDGVDLAPALLGKGPSPRQEMFFYRGTTLYAVRNGPWKAHFVTKPAYGQNLKETLHDPPLLYHLERDPGEKLDAAKDHPDVVSDLKAVAERHRATVKPVENQLER